MADIRAAVALADDERTFREAMVDGLKELMIATQQLREQNAAWAAHHEETQRRLAALEARDEKQSDKAEARAVDKLRQRIEMDWKVLSLCISGGINLLQLLGGHVSWHW